MRHFWLGVPVFVAASVVGLLRAADKPAEAATLQGEVIALNELLKTERIEFEPEMGLQLGLRTDGGKVLPLLRDVGSARFFNDPKLLKRPMRVKVRAVAGGALWQVLEVHSLKNGKPHEIYYWCEVCSIRRDNLRPSKDCECCGGPMELREVPIK